MLSSGTTSPSTGSRGPAAGGGSLSYGTSTWTLSLGAPRPHLQGRQGGDWPAGTVTLRLGVCAVRGETGPLTREGSCVQVGKLTWDSVHAESEKNCSRATLDKRLDLWGFVSSADGRNMLRERPAAAGSHRGRREFREFPEPLTSVVSVEATRVPWCSRAGETLLLWAHVPLRLL